MSDEKFGSIITTIGKAKIANAALLGQLLILKTLKVGDSNGSYYEPTEDQKDLLNVKYTSDIGSIRIDTKNPNWIIAETVIPANVGGFTIREVGLFDIDGDLIVIHKYPETYKPIVENGAAKDIGIRTIFEVSNTDSITLSLDPSVIIATKDDIINLQEQINENRASLEDLANENLFINGDLSIWQRYPNRLFSTDGTQNANNIYFIDRFNFKTDHLNNEYEFSYDEGLKIVQTKTCGDVYSYFTLKQFTECILNEDADVTISFKVKNLSPDISRIRLIINEESISVENKGDGVYSFTTKVKSSTQLYGCIDLGNNGCIGNIGTIKYIKLEIGDKATPFYPRPYGEELALCQRYYQIINTLHSNGYMPKNTNIVKDVIFPTTMRTIPTVNVIVGGSSISGVDKTTASATETNNSKTTLYVRKDASDGYYNMYHNLTLDAEIY